jgi:hypothetical protein
MVKGWSLEQTRNKRGLRRNESTWGGDAMHGRRHTKRDGWAKKRGRHLGRFSGRSALMVLQSRIPSRLSLMDGAPRRVVSRPTNGQRVNEVRNFRELRRRSVQVVTTDHLENGDHVQVSGERRKTARKGRELA